MRKVKTGHRDNRKLERHLAEKGVVRIAGVDEAGRGPLAGPVFAAAIVLPPDYYHRDVDDSKKLNPTIRKQLAEILKENAVAWAVASASVHEIEIINIRQATFLAMRRALAMLAPQPEYLLVDGDSMPDSLLPGTNVIKGDHLSFTIAAASILAKVARDKYMTELHDQYPEYAFNHNMGYGTAEHITAIKKHGPTVHHRKLFLRNILRQTE